MTSYKKYILSLGIGAILATSALAEDAVTYTEKTITGKYTNTDGARTDITGVNATTDLILNSTPNGSANTGEMYRVRDITAHTVKAVNGDVAGDVNIAASYNEAESRIGYLTVDVNSATDITAISASSWKHNYATVNVINSNADASKANVTIDFGNALTIDSTSVNQEQALNIGVAKGTVNAKTTTVGASAPNSTLKINEGANLTWTGIINVGNSNATKASKLIVDGKLTMKSTSSNHVFLYNGTSLSVGSNGALNMGNNSFTLASGATATIDGSFAMAGGCHANINGTMTVNNTAPTSQMNVYWLSTIGTFTQATATKNNGIRLWRKANFKNGSNWTVDEILDLYGNVVANTDTETTRAYAIMEEGSKMVITKANNKTARIRLWGNSELQLHQANVFTDQNGDSIRLATAYSESGYSDMGSVVRLYSEQTFSDIYITTGSNLEIYLENDLAKLILNGTGRTVSNTTKEGLTIYNFREDSIYVGTDKNTVNGIANATFYDTNENLVNVWIGDDGWLTAVAAVPEPAEWAMLLGGLALGLAIYRRRK